VAASDLASGGIVKRSIAEDTRFYNDGGGSRLAIYALPVSNFQDEHGDFLVLNIADRAKVSYAVPTVRAFRRATAYPLPLVFSRNELFTQEPLSGLLGHGRDILHRTSSLAGRANLWRIGGPRLSKVLDRREHPRKPRKCDESGAPVRHLDAKKEGDRS
jgi:hypothetical protein